MSIRNIVLRDEIQKQGLEEVLFSLFGQNGEGFSAVGNPYLEIN
jgi:hypothetical protein